ncbi:aldo/keto reductase [Saccharopolyspora hirsuta]|uniref:Aldo/keto reductase n=2 Tax=Saccharopolyspora hirsuta TaxID=1837 RepID=A0A5M7CDF4_SACHI|nr:aldo/keto reductase [Saccharopolyspora hirsuta]
MKLDQQASAEVIGAALDAGITHLDTAEMYGEGRSEEYIGAALGARRDEVVIATKFLPRPKDEPYTPGALRKRILEACEGSLRRLRTDRIDLYYQHYPDAEAPVDEALETLDELVRQGKVLHVASSNVNAEQIATAANVSAERSLVRFCGTQIEWNLLSRDVERSTVPAERENGLGVVPYFPLASGMLTGKYRRGSEFPAGSRFDAMSFFADRFVNDESFARVEALTAFAEERGRSILELPVAWLAAQDGVASVITGATTPDQVRANAAASWTLTSADLAALR